MGITPSTTREGLPESVLRNFELLEVAATRLAHLKANDPQLQACLNHKGEDAELLDDAICPSAIDILHHLCQLYHDRPAMGYCPPWAPPSSYTTLTFRQLWGRVQALAAGLHARGILDVRRGGGEPSFIGICGFASVDWCMAEFVGLYFGAVVVPLPLNVTSTDLAYMMGRGGMSLLFLSVEEAHTESVIKAIDATPGITTVVLMDSFGSAADLEEVKSLPYILAWQAQKGLTVLSMEEVEATNTGGGPPPPMAIPGKGGIEADPLLSLMYTSGSTGLPKGACLNDSLEKAYWRMGIRQMQLTAIPQVLLGYMPLNHAGGRLTVRQALVSGGTVYFIRRSDMSTLLEDTATVRPTSLLLVPRISNMIHETYLSMVGKCPPGVSPQEHEVESRRRLREEVLGGRLVMAVAGTAPTSPEVLDLIRDACQMPVLDGYGSTECGGMTIDCRISDNVTEYHLEDVPELGYTTTDQPYPRGELLVKTKTGIRCYYKDEGATAQLIDEDGFYHTGDIMEQRGPDVFVWVDRRKNVIKLSQGEYVSVSRLEAFFSGSSAIHQIYLYGNSLRSYLLAVVVPSTYPHKDSMTEEDKANDRALIRAELDRIGKDGSLQGFEVPRHFMVDYEPFSRANSLLTDSNKPARARLRAHYGEELEELYRATEERKEKKRQELMKNPLDSNLEERFKAALEVTLGLDTHEIDLGRSFLHSGGDSLYAVRFAHNLREICQATVPVAAILNPTATLQTLLEVVQEASTAQSGGVTVSSVHGHNTAVIRAQDILLDRFIPAEDLQQAATLPSPPMEAPRVVLVTGANGFLGRFLVHELLVYCARHGGPGAQVVALVRAGDDDMARERLLSSYGAPDNELRQVVEKLASSYLTVYGGDLGRPLLGLSKAVYDSLCQEVDLVMHNGALVNHTFTYDQLFLPNVVGTSQLLHLAIQHKKKAFHFISTVGVAFGYGTSEDAYGTRLGVERRTDGGYASGYGASKWACEVMLEKAAEELKLPVTLYRCGLILPHSGPHLGQINVPDMFTRLVCGLVYSKIAPPSFYDLSASSTCHPIFDGLPVDFVAKSIVGLAVEGRRKNGNGSLCVMYQVLEANHATGSNLDDILGWIQSAGYTVVKMEDYGVWAAEFRNRCQGMKQASPIPLMHQWDRPSKPDPALNLTADHYHAALKAFLGITSLPTIDEAYVHHCLRHMAALGLIKHP